MPSFFKTIFIFCLLLSQSIFSFSEETQKKGTWKEYFSGKQSSDASTSKKSKKNRPAFGYADPSKMISLLDIPTASILRYGGFASSFRFYKQGGVISTMNFGIFNRFNLGMSLDTEKIVGTEKSTVRTPGFQTRFRIFDGGQVLPAMSLGYDSQSRYFDSEKDAYEEKSRGLFLSLSREFFFPGFEFSGGANISEFKEAQFFGYWGLSYVLENKAALFIEQDAISTKNSRVNAGIRLFITVPVTVDIGFRRIFNHESVERIVQVTYLGDF